MEIRKLTMLSMLLALSVVFNIVESTIPFIGGVIPGVKLGLSNIIILFVIYMYTFKEAMYVSIGKVIIISLVRTGLFGITFFFSLGGAILSTISMYMVKRYTKLSIIGISIIGSLTHSIGQILIAMLMLRTFNVIFYLPYILILTIPTGIVVGMMTRNVLKFYNVKA